MILYDKNVYDVATAMDWRKFLWARAGGRICTNIRMDTKKTKTQPKCTKSAGGVVLNSKGEVLVVNQNGNSWSLPKGHIDAGEDAITAAKREIYEESGITELEQLGELGTYERYRIGKGGVGEDISEIKSVLIFLFRTTQTELKPSDVTNPEARWVPREKVAELLTHPKDKEFFKSIIGRI